MSISSCTSCTTNLPESIKSPADALAVLAAKKGMDAQKTEAAALISLLDPNAGRNLNVSA
ncbi:MAG: hypothetical protein AB7J35_15815 [Dehalococcoidia bacterium]